MEKERRAGGELSDIFDSGAPKRVTPGEKKRPQLEGESSHTHEGATKTSELLPLSTFRSYFFRRRSNSQGGKIIFNLGGEKEKIKGGNREITLGNCKRNSPCHYRPF